MVGTGRRTARGLLALTLGAVLLAGCSASQPADSGGSATAPEAGAPATVPGAPDERQADLAAGAGAGTTTETSVALQDRAVISTASLRLRAEDVLAASKQAVVLVRSAGGLVAGEQTVVDPSDPDRTTSLLTLRVPAGRLPGLLEDLAGLGTVLAQDQTATDVTGQVVDVEARLKTQQESVDRVRALLARAKTIGEVVTIEAELARREADLEALQAQAKALADQTSLATVTVTVVGPDPLGTEDDPVGFVAGLERGWTAFTTVGTWLLTALGAVLPFLLLALAIGLPLLLALRRRRPVAPATPPAAESELVDAGR